MMTSTHSIARWLPPGFKPFVTSAIPAGCRTAVWRARRRFHEWRTEQDVRRLYRRIRRSPPKANDRERVGPYVIRINDGWTFYNLYKDIFAYRIYHFTSVRPAPRIIDCGSNIGGSILYYKWVYPKARIVGFEPDPSLFPYLRTNITDNGLTDVTLVQAALSAQEGSLRFYSDGKAGSCLAHNLPSDAREWQPYDVPCVRLAEYLSEPVDFLKMNIESAEWEVLADNAHGLSNIHEMVIEYHHLPGIPRTLHHILALLDRQGFEYAIHHFDYHTNPQLKPPFELRPETRYYLLIYAKQRQYMERLAEK